MTVWRVTERGGTSRGEPIFLEMQTSTTMECHLRYTAMCFNSTKRKKNIFKNCFFSGNADLDYNGVSPPIHCNVFQQKERKTFSKNTFFWKCRHPATMDCRRHLGYTACTMVFWWFALSLVHALDQSVFQQKERGNTFSEQRTVASVTNHPNHLFLNRFFM